MPRNVRRILILIGSVVLAIAFAVGIILFVIMNNEEKSYRTILASEWTGTVTITRQKGEPFQIYEGLSFRNGDDVSVKNASSLTMNVDDDKHLYAEENTDFTFESAGKEGETKTKIVLKNGGVLCQIEKKLAAGETFDVETPSGTMSVRGTIFRVSTAMIDGQLYVLAEVYDGSVEANIEGDSVTFEKGYCVVVKSTESGENAVFVREDELDDSFWNSGLVSGIVTSQNGSGNKALTIPYEAVPTPVVDTLKDYVNNSNQTLPIPPEAFDSIQNQGHIYTETTVREVSCEEDGLLQYDCNYCKDQYTVTIPAFGHDYEVSIENATCTKDGLKTFTCKNDPKHTYTEVIPMLPHPFVYEVAVAPTCEQTGVSASSYCPACGLVNESPDVIPALGHDYVASETMAPTCERAGLLTYACSHDSSHTYSENLPALGHIWNDGEVTTKPTCDGVGVRTFTCERDHAHTYTEAVEAIGHNYRGSITTPATCETTGVLTYVCSNDPSHTYTQEISAIGHDYRSYVSEEPTCEGYGTTVYYCLNDQNHYFTVPITPIGHYYDQGTVTTPATCEDEGVMTFTCQHDGNHTYTQPIPALGHSYDKGVVTTPATCEDDGVKTFTCQHDKAHTYTEPVSALGHRYNSGVITTPATCTEKGVKTFTCLNDSEHTYTREIAAIGHSYDEGVVTTQPTCTQQGVKTFTCQNNTVHTYTVDIKPLGHDYDEGTVTTDPTCTEKGVKTFTCQNDSEHTYTEDVDPLGHDYDEGVVTTDPTCTEKGVKTFTCQNDETHTYTEDVDPLGHDFTEVAETEATCTESGNETYYTCSGCEKLFVLDGEDYVETTLEEVTISAKGHSYTEHAAVDPTCAAAGNTLYYTCENCTDYFIKDGETYTKVTQEETILPTTGKHTEPEGLEPDYVYTNYADQPCYYYEYTCEVCKKDIKVSFEHNFQEPEIQSALLDIYESEGLTYKWCPDCYVELVVGTKHNFITYSLKTEGAFNYYYNYGQTVQDGFEMYYVLQTDISCQNENCSHSRLNRLEITFCLHSTDGTTFDSLTYFVQTGWMSEPLPITITDEKGLAEFETLLKAEGLYELHEAMNGHVAPEGVKPEASEYGCYAYDTTCTVCGQECSIVKHHDYVLISLCYNESGEIEGSGNNIFYDDVQECEIGLVEIYGNFRCDDETCMAESKLFGYERFYCLGKIDEHRNVTSFEFFHADFVETIDMIGGKAAITIENQEDYTALCDFVQDRVLWIYRQWE